MESKVGVYEIFDTEDQMDSIFWHLLNLLGGKVVIPTDQEFWNTAVEPGVSHRVVLRKEDGNLVLVAEKQAWQQA